MRASCETDLIGQGHPIQTVAKWMGHSPKVAVGNYLRVLDEHYDTATRGESPRRTAKCAALGAHREAHRETETPENSLKTASCNFRHPPLADGKGFEPPVDFRPQRFSRPPP